MKVEGCAATPRSSASNLGPGTGDADLERGIIEELLMARPGTYQLSKRELMEALDCDPANFEKSDRVDFAVTALRRTGLVHVQGGDMVSLTRAAARFNELMALIG